MYIRAGKKKFFRFMFFDQFNQVDKTLFAVENFPFPVLNILLKIIGSGFGNTEVLHAVRNFYPHLLTDPEKMIHSISGCKDDCRKIQNVDPQL